MVESGLIDDTQLSDRLVVLLKRLDVLIKDRPGNIKDALKWLLNARSTYISAQDSLSHIMSCSREGKIALSNLNIIQIKFVESRGERVNTLWLEYLDNVIENFEAVEDYRVCSEICRQKIRPLRDTQNLIHLRNIHAELNRLNLSFLKVVREIDQRDRERREWMNTGAEANYIRLGHGKNSQNKVRNFWSNLENSSAPQIIRNPEFRRFNK